jgi:superkiller protein 3
MEEEALSELAVALSQDAELAAAHELRGRVFVRRERYEEALAHLDRALELDPALAESWVLKALSHYRLSALDSALEAAERAIECDERMERAWLLAGEILRDRERTGEAIACFEKVVSLSPNDAVAHRRLGDLYARAGRHEDARRHRAFARRLHGFGGAVEMEIGDLFHSEGELEQALECYRRAALSFPWDSEHFLKMGVAYRENELSGASFHALAGAMQVDPGNVASYVELARIFEEVGRHGEAVAMLRAAIAVDPEAAEAKERLRQWTERRAESR